MALDFKPMPVHYMQASSPKWPGPGNAGGYFVRPGTWPLKSERPNPIPGLSSRIHFFLSGGAHEIFESLQVISTFYPVTKGLI
jgi:hypothetical protein